MFLSIFGQLTINQAYAWMSLGHGFYLYFQKDVASEVSE